MKNILSKTFVVAILTIIFFTACSSGSGNSVTFNSIPEFQEWLSNQEANTIASPYNVTLNLRDEDLEFHVLNYSEWLGNIINSTRRYVGITLGSGITRVGDMAFSSCAFLISINIPSTVTSIGDSAFLACVDLVSITFGSTIPESNLHMYAFDRLGDLREKYIAGGAGTYTMTNQGTLFDPIRVWTRR